MPYINRIEVRNHYKLSDFAIDFGADTSGRPFRHLILTGPNGSGKTTILSQLAMAVENAVTGQGNGRPRETAARELAQIEQSIPQADEKLRLLFEQRLAALRGALEGFLVDTHWFPALPTSGEVLAVYLPASRALTVEKPKAIENVSPRSGVSLKERLATQFLKHLVNLEVQARLAKDEEPETAAALTAWLSNLERALGALFEIPNLRMEFIRKDYDIRFVEPGGAEYDFNQLAAGHASVLNILAEILLRIPEGELGCDNLSFATSAGVVIIDEIETHLHPSMQERILPFLTQAFPSMQFIVATHSPAVICSIDHAIVWDLRAKEAVPSEELRGTPYGELMKLHFGIASDVDLESTKQLMRLQELRDKIGRNAAEDSEYRELSARLRKTSSALALEVWTQLEQARLAGIKAP